MSLLCRLGWHDWTRWIDGLITRGGRRIAGQSRQCRRCHKAERREL